MSADAAMKSCILIWKRWSREGIKLLFVCLRYFGDKWLLLFSWKEEEIKSVVTESSKVMWMPKKQQNALDILWQTLEKKPISILWHAAQHCTRLICWSKTNNETLIKRIKFSLCLCANYPFEPKFWAEIRENFIDAIADKFSRED